MANDEKTSPKEQGKAASFHLCVCEVQRMMSKWQKVVCRLQLANLEGFNQNSEDQHV